MLSSRKRRLAPISKTAMERVQAFLSVNPTLRVAELVKLAECDEALASKARKAYFEAHPEQEALARQAPPQPKPISLGEQRVRALLAENPQYTPSQIAHRIRYSLNDVRKLLARIKDADTAPTSTVS